VLAAAAAKIAGDAKEETMTAPHVRSRDEIPDDAYRKMVLTLMDKQASREAATAEVFGRCGVIGPLPSRVKRWRGSVLD